MGKFFPDTTRSWTACVSPSFHLCNLISPDYSFRKYKSIAVDGGGGPKGATADDRHWEGGQGATNDDDDWNL